MFALTLPSFARSCIAMKFGIAIAARIPMITTTIISSISVKPFWVSRHVTACSGLNRTTGRQPCRTPPAPETCVCDY